VLGRRAILDGWFYERVDILDGWGKVVQPEADGCGKLNLLPSKPPFFLPEFTIRTLLIRMLLRPPRTGFGTFAV